MTDLTPACPRMIVPDAARGMALLGIALANAPTAWLLSDQFDVAASFGGVHDGNAADQATVLLTALFAHNRGLPMFSTLLGFGVGLIALSLWRRRFPVDRARVVLLRRYGFLAVFGLFHGVFLFHGDIMLFYGISAMLLAAMMTLSNKTLMRVAWGLFGVSVFFGLATIATISLSLGGSDISPHESMHDVITADTYLGLVSQNLGNLAFMAFGYLFFVVPYFPVMIIGFVWARRGVLADVTAHRRELAAWLWAGIAVVVLVGLPWGLSTLQVLPAAWEDPLVMANQTFGVLTGPAILAGLALVLDGMQKRIDAGAATPGLLVPFVALGKRSMSGYLMQSIVFFVLTQPFLLNMGHNVGAFAEAGIAIAVWASTLLTAWALEAAGRPGPFEWAHRRLSYGKTMRPELPAGR